MFEDVKTDKVAQEQTRERFNKFRKETFNPPVRRLAEEVGISFSYLSRWSRGHVDVGEMAMAKILYFLDEQGY